jgi:hypothetical protein
MKIHFKLALREALDRLWSEPAKQQYILVSARMVNMRIHVWNAYAIFE